MIRITNTMMANTLTRNMNNNLKNMNELQEQVATGRKINKPSDDPGGLVRSLRLRSDITANEQYLANISDSLSYMDTTESAMNNLTSVVNRVRELTVQAANGTNDDSALQSIAEELSQLREQIRTISNSTYGSKYVFAGSNVTEAPCTEDGQWTGNNIELMREIGSEVRIPVNMDMKSWFIQQGQSISGTSASTDISGLPASPPPSFQIQVDGDATVHTITMNPLGPPALNNGTDIATAMQTAINAIVQPGYDYAGVTVTYDAVNGYIISSASTGINSGVQITSAPDGDVADDLKLGIANGGTENAGMFAVMDQVINAVKNRKSDTTSDLLDKIDEKLDTLLTNRSIVGARTNRLEMQQTRLKNIDISYTGLLSTNEDADMAEVSVKLQMQENVYNASLAIGAKIIQPSLIDFLD
ncbi:MAG: flagellar hook-associated protein FlgL [Syntrophomonadaceae bacterium]